MAFRLTLILAVVLYVVLRFGGGPIPDKPVASAPETETVTETETASKEASVDETAPSVDADQPAPEQEPRVATETATPDSGGSDTGTSAIAIEDAVAEALSIAPDATTESPDDEGPTTLPGLSLGNLQINGNNASALSLADSVRQRSEATQADPLAPVEIKPQVEETTQPNLAQTGLLGDSGESPSIALPKARITATSVNLRAGPSTAESVVGRVSQGDVVEVIGTSFPGWTGIRHPERGDTVYVSSQFLQNIDN